MRAAILLTMLAGTAMACRAPSTPDGTKDGAALSASLDIAYGVDAARPRTSLDLHIPPTGDAELFVGAMPEDTDTIGYFRAPVAAETRAALSQLVSSKKLMSRSGGPSATAEGSGFLRLASGSEKAELSLVSADEAVTALRTKLDEILAEVAHHPVRALKMTLGATREGATWRPEILLTQVGTEPLSVLFFDPANPMFCLRATATAGARGPASVLAPSDVAALVQSKALPGGVSSVPAGSVYHLPLAPLAAAASPDGGTVDLTGSVTFWLPGTGLSRRAVDHHARTAAR
jgi:hypothetical protein